MALRLMRLVEVPETTRDRVFSYSRERALLFLIAVVCAGAATIAFHWPTRRLAYWIAGVFLLTLLLTQRFVSARFRPSNWLAKLGDEGVFIKFRSYLNYHLPAEDRTVVFIPYGDIRSARLVRERTKTRDMNGGTAVQARRLVELELGSDPAALAAELTLECSRKAPLARRWYGTSSTLYDHYPVRMPTPPFLRVEWQVVPRAAFFLDALRPYSTIAPPVELTEDFANLQGLSGAQQQERLRELARRGQTIAAVYMARRLYGYGLSEATAFVKGLNGEPSS